MNAKHKGKEGSQARRIAKEKVIPVAEGSMQSKPPGAGPSPGVSRQFGSQQQAGSGADKAGARGGPGSQQSGWSSRQQAERMHARGEESRQGLPQQSGYGGMEQDQHAGSRESGAKSKAPGSGSKQ